MNALRLMLLRHRRLTGWIVAATLLMRLIVPTGYMFASVNGAIGVTLCGGQTPAPTPMAMSGMTISGTTGHDHGQRHDHARTEPPCAFSGLGHGFLSAADPIMLAVAIAFAFAAVFRRPALPPARARAFARPPARGPPALA